jgi:hypothetical protein
MFKVGSVRLSRTGLKEKSSPTNRGGRHSVHMVIFGKGKSIQKKKLFHQNKMFYMRILMEKCFFELIT